MNDAATAQETPAVKQETLQDVNTEYFPLSEAEKAQAAMERVVRLLGDTKPIVNGDWPTTGNVPETHGILILPVGKTEAVMETIIDPETKQAKVIDTGRKQRVTKNVVMAAVPTFATVLATDEGKSYLQEALLAAQSAKLRNAVNRLETDGDIGDVTLPFTVEQFLEKGERGAGEGLAAFRAVGPLLVKHFNKINVPINLAMLRNILQSAAFAKSFAPDVPQKVWERAIAAGREESKNSKYKLSNSGQIWDHWENTRNTTSLEIKLDENTEINL